MVLSFIKYTQLLRALDTHCKPNGKKEVSIRDLQKAILSHYLERDRFLVAENINSSKRLFVYRERKKAIKQEMRDFIKHMDEELIVKPKNKKKYVKGIKMQLP